MRRRNLFPPFPPEGSMAKRSGTSVRSSISLVALAALTILPACIDEPLSPSAGPPLASLSTVDASPYTPGVPVFGANSYVEYIPGNLPVIFTAPHGGALQPSSIPNRTAETCGGSATTVTDSNTEQLTRAIQSAFHERTGGYPHIVIVHLRRTKLDANRDLPEAACGNEEAEQAWHEFHEFVEIAKSRVLAEHGRGWYTDIHGHGHTVQRLELGYQISAANLRRSDAVLDAGTTYERNSSFRIFSEQSPLSFSALLRGSSALGTLFENAGVRSVPSQQDPFPNVGEDFFSGGYNTNRHGCSGGGLICGVQIEANMTGVRDNATNRARFAARLVEVYDEFLHANFGIDLPLRSATPRPEPGLEIVVDNNNANNDPTVGSFVASSNWSNATNSQSWPVGSNNFRLSSAGSSFTNDGAEFFFYIGTPGTYRVDSWWPASSVRSSGVAYRVFELDGGAMLADLRINQKVNGAQWNELGAYRFTRVGWAKVLISRSLSTTTDGTSLAADAIRVTLVSASNRDPVARINGPITASEGATLAFDGTRSSDPDGEALTFSWSFGDGASASGSAPSHTYADDGMYVVTLTVSDGNGGSAAASRTITVNNVAPTVDAGADAVIRSGATYSFAGTFSDPGANDAPWSWTLDWDGETETGATSSRSTPITASRRFCSVGSRSVTLTVRDKDGGEGSDALQLTVQRYPVQLAIHPGAINLAGNEGANSIVTAHVLSTADFDATALDVQSLRLTSGDGSGAEVARRNNGTWRAERTDIDGDGRPDLLLQFTRSSLLESGDLTSTTTSLRLVGTAGGCRHVEGIAAVRIVR
jgi:hypothetical protein